MSVIINGDTGITTPAETVQGALTTTGNTILGDSSADTLNVGNGGLVKDASGNVGIGTSSPGAKLGVAGDVRILANAGVTSHSFNYNENGGEISLYDETGATASLFDQASNSTRLLELINGSNLLLGLGSANTTGAVQFMGAGYTERMRIDSSGNLLVGTTSSFDSGAICADGGNNSKEAIACRVTQTTNSNQISFRNGNGVVGTITTNGSATAYNTSSDYRLKENVAPMTGALEKVALLKPCTYKWKVDGSDGQGFIAHELDAVVPGCVTGEKDAVDAEGNPQYQGIDTSFLVATLTAAIQEQQALITQLQADVATLKALSA